MLNFFISIVVLAFSAFLLAVSIRYGMIGAARLDSWLSTKSKRNFKGFDWYYRIPFPVGTIPEYFYAMVLGKDNYFKTNWWALKTSSFLSVLLFIALLKSRTSVVNYYSLLLSGDQGITAFATSGTFIWYMNIITLSYLALFILICVESVKMAGIYSPIRIIYFGILSIFLANLTVAVLSVIIFVSIVYLVYKIVKFLFFKNNNTSQQYNEEETAGEILNKGFSGFKPDLYEWEAERKAQRKNEKVKQKPKRNPVITTRKRIVKREPEVVIHNEDIPRLHPD
jgi:hypothetical protein